MESINTVMRIENQRALVTGTSGFAGSQLCKELIDFVLRLENRKVQEMVGWEPQVSIDDGLCRTTEWIKEHLGKYRLGEYQR